MRAIRRKGIRPGNLGRDCPGNGTHYSWRKRKFLYLCDECDYMLCCLEDHDEKECINCEDEYCARAKAKKHFFEKMHISLSGVKNRDKIGDKGV